ncbi:hypothetical protein [Pseudomonas sp. TH03]|uniref:hypothetical protein n=1 Tax=Pseudomonas sp. TH03 TaxID=2796369 RepID=UPI001F5BA094|nr:hypothetical protein [Pseudomonas sp. TH03]
MNELKKQHAALIAEREMLEMSLPQLDAAWRNAPSNYSPVGNMIGSPEGRAAEDYRAPKAVYAPSPASWNELNKSSLTWSVWHWSNKPEQSL